MAKKSDKPNPEPLDRDDASTDDRSLATILEEIAVGVKVNTAKLEHLEREQQKTSTKLEHLEREQQKTFAKLGHFEREQEKTNIAVETYQKASGQVVNLAFGLIATATITIVLSAIANR